MNKSLLPAARTYIQNGIRVVRVRADGTDNPAVENWEEYRNRFATDTELVSWFASNQEQCGIAIIAGLGSGNLEVMRLVDSTTYLRLHDLCSHEGLSELIDSMPVMGTPSGELRLVYRREDQVGDDTILAYHLTDIPSDAYYEVRGTREHVTFAGETYATKLHNGTKKALVPSIRTYGEGTYVVASPTTGYQYLQHDPTLIPTISATNIGSVHRLARSLNENGDEQQMHPTDVKSEVQKKGEDTNPGVDYNTASGYAVVRDDGFNIAEATDGEEAEELPLTIVQIVKGYADEAELFITDGGEASACIRHNGRKEVYKVRSRAFGQYLRARYYADFKKVLSKQVVEDVLAIVEASCLFERREKRKLSVRVAEDEGTNALYYDLADPPGRAVRITSTGWQIDNDPPTLFRRYKAVGQQVEPLRGGTIYDLRPFLNVKDEETFYLIVPWLVAAVFPNIAHPVLIMHGEQGVGKSTFMRIVGPLIDPSPVQLRSMPRDSKAWRHGAAHSWLNTLDNVSDVKQSLSDDFCLSVTGGADVSRVLYTDEEDAIVEFRCVIALTGITAAAQKPDLLDRSLLIGLERIPGERRIEESKLLAQAEAARPKILGALFDLVSGVLRELPEVTLSRMPRMADFARVGVAVERVLGWPDGAFLRAYERNIGSQHEEAVDASPVGDIVRRFMRDQPGGEWKGTASALLSDLDGFQRKTGSIPRDFPRSAKSLSEALRRISPNLGATGIQVSFTTPHEGRLITLRCSKQL